MACCAISCFFVYAPRTDVLPVNSVEDGLHGGSGAGAGESGVTEENTGGAAED